MAGSTSPDGLEVPDTGGVGSVVTVVGGSVVTVVGGSVVTVVGSSVVTVVGGSIGGRSIGGTVDRRQVDRRLRRRWIHADGTFGGHRTAPSAGGLAKLGNSSASGNAACPAAAGSADRSVGIATNWGAPAAINAPKVCNVARCCDSTHITLAINVRISASGNLVRFARYVSMATSSSVAANPMTPVASANVGVVAWTNGAYFGFGAS